MKTSSLVLLACLTIAALVPFAAAVTPQETAAANSVFVGPDYAYGNANAAAQLCFSSPTSDDDTDAPHSMQHAGAAIIVGHRYVSVFALVSADGTYGQYLNSTDTAWRVDDISGTWTLTDNDAGSGHGLTLARAEAVNQTVYAGASRAPQFDLLAVAWTALPGDETSFFADESGFSCSSGGGYFDDALTGWSSVACGPEQSAQGTTTRAIEAIPGYAAKDTSANYLVWQAVALYFDVTNLTGSEATSCSPSAVDCFTITSNLAAPFAFSPFQDVLSVAAILGGAVALVVLIVAPRRRPNDDEDEDGHEGEGEA